MNSFLSSDFRKISSRLSGLTIVILICHLLLLNVKAGDAYVFELKDGMIVKGSILSENKDLIIVNLEEVNGIQGQTQIQKSQISKKTKVPDDEIAYKKLPSLAINPRHSYNLKEYNNLISAAEAFITAYPQSPLTGSVQNALTLIKAEQLRVSKGEVKSGGEWLTPAEVVFMSYDIKANILYDEMLEYQQKNNFSESKRVFTEIEKKYPASIAYYQAGAQMIDWMDKQIKSRQIEITALEAKMATLEKGKSENNARIAESKSKVAASSSPNYATVLKNQINVMEGMVNKINNEINTIQNQIFTAKTLLNDYQTELTRLQQTPFAKLSKQGSYIKQMEAKFKAGKISEVKNMINMPELQKFERTRNMNSMIIDHDKIIQQMKSEISAKNYDAAIETGNNGLKEFPGSDQINALIEEARTVRSQTVQIN